MKKVKVFHMGKRLKDIYPHATKWQVIKFRLRKLLLSLVVVSFIAGILYTAFKLGGILNPYTVYEDVTVVEKVAPVLKRIATCESNSKHFDANGQVLVVGNKNKSVDIGRYQINNKIWGKKATELKLNLMVEDDNELMAEWIYNNHGTEPWYLTKSCWNK